MRFFGDEQIVVRIDVFAPELRHLFAEDVGVDDDSVADDIEPRGIKYPRGNGVQNEF